VPRGLRVKPHDNFLNPWPPAPTPTVAPCPGCGAPVEFRSAQSAFAVCSYCRSTVVREGATLARIGKMAEVFEDFSPLQLLARGRWQGRPSRWSGGCSTAAPAALDRMDRLFADGSTGLAGEDNGAYVLALPATHRARRCRSRSSCASAPPPRSTARATRSAPTSRSRWSRRRASCPSCRRSARPSRWWNCAAPTTRCWPSTTAARRRRCRAAARCAGRPAAHRPARRQRQGRAGPQFACPNCGAPVEVLLADSKSITCRACNSLIDLRRASAASWHTAAGRAGAAADPAGQQRPAAGRALAGGRLPAPHGHRARTIPTSTSAGTNTCCTTPSAASLSWSTPRGLEPGEADHRRPRSAENGSSAATSATLPAAVRLQGADHLRRRRVLLAGGARPEDLQPRLRQGQERCCRWRSSPTRSPGRSAARSRATRWPRPSSWTRRRTCFKRADAGR
jgi:hypothetical protein